MNASFSILQKLKNQFLSSVQDASSYHVAFAPFAFTMTSEDFYFLKGSASTGQDALKYLREQSQFSVLANSMLQKPYVWGIDGEHLLYDAYKDVLDDGRLINPDSMAPEEQAKVDAAKALLYDETGQETAKYKTYKKYGAAAHNLDAQILDCKSSRETLPQNDTLALEKWRQQLALLEEERQDTLTEWQAIGFKAEIETAKAVYNSVTAKKSAFVVQWQNARQNMDSGNGAMTDEYGVTFMPTTCIPNSIGDPSAPVWRKASLNKAELGELTKTFTQTVPPAVLADFGEVSPELDAITFEYCMLDIQRPWFDEALINNRWWRFSEPNRWVSQGDDSMRGEMPAFPVKILLAKNIELAFTPQSPTNVQIRDRLRRGERLFFGPLLLKSIPDNLQDDQIKSFRVQQVGGKELAVLSRVATDSPKPASIAAPDRMQLLQVMNRRSAAELHRNLEARSAVVAPSSMVGRGPGFIGGGPVRPLGGPVGGPSLAPPRPPHGLPPHLQPRVPPYLPPVIKPVRPFPLGPVVKPDVDARPALFALRGKVWDANNRPVAGAEVQLMNENTAVTRCALSEADGSYVLDNVDGDSYQCKVRKAGFVTQERSFSIQANLSQDYRLAAIAVPVDSFQVIGVVCRRLPRLPDPLPNAQYL